MYLGSPNIYAAAPMKKLKITPEPASGIMPIEVLYNPESYVQSRRVRPNMARGVGAQSSNVTTVTAGMESLKFKLFFDTLSAGSEVGGPMVDRLKFAGNSVLPAPAKFLDVRKYTGQIYALMDINTDLHRPPKLTLEWNSLSFEGVLVSCTQTFVRFNELGMPVRAWLDCEFIEARNPSRVRQLNPLNSPDTTKFRTVRQGDTLWSIAEEEYGQAELWRAIADANGIVNPRLLRTGDRLAVPALV